MVFCVLKGGERPMAYTPELSLESSRTLRRIAWALGVPMTQAIERVFEYMPSSWIETRFVRPARTNRSAANVRFQRNQFWAISVACNSISINFNQGLANKGWAFLRSSKRRNTMENQNINQQFREDEIANIRRWDKERNEYITNPFPKIGGRLRLAHEANEALSIETEIIRYDEQIAVVSAVSKTSKGCFKGIGMASVERDAEDSTCHTGTCGNQSHCQSSLRFAGYGVEYCSAEEVSHLRKR